MYRFLSRLLPSQCLVCHGWARAQVCEECVAQFNPAQTRCSRCARTLPRALGTDSDSARQCGQCLRQPPTLHACAAAVDYAYPWDSLIARFKFTQLSRRGSWGEPGLARSMAAIMAQNPRIRQLLGASDAIMPIPLSPERQSERGFNQSLELLKNLRLECPTPRRPLHSGVLLRARHTPPQVGLSQPERMRNMHHAFVCDPLLHAHVAGRTLLLIDDVATTTSTLNAAAAALLSAGAAQVSAVVFARTPG